MGTELILAYLGVLVVLICFVGWVGVKLAVLVMAHPQVAWIPERFPHSSIWQITFYSVLVLIVLIGWFSSGHSKIPDHEHKV